MDKKITIENKLAVLDKNLAINDYLKAPNLNFEINV